MQFTKRLCDVATKGCEVMGILCLSAAKTMEKDGRLKTIHFSSVCEEGESPRAL